MLEELKRLWKHSIIYGLSNLLSTAVGFILLPLYTRFLTPADYGIWDLLMVTMALVAVVLQMGLGSALFKVVLYDEQIDRRKLISTALYLLAGGSLIILIPLCVFAASISELILGSREHADLTRWIFISAYLNALIAIPLARLRIYDESLKYGLVNISRFVVSMLLNIYFVAVLDMGVRGLVFANVLQSALFAVVLLALLGQDLKPALSMTATREMLRFGLPLVLTGVAGAVITMSSRFFLRHFGTMHEVGLFGVGSRIAMIFALVVASFQLAWPSVLFSAAKREDAKIFFATALTYCLFVFTFISLGLSVLANEVVTILAGPEFQAAYKVVPLLVLAQVFMGAYFVTAVGTNLKKRTEYQALATVAGAAVTIGLSFVLIPAHGMVGAALATLAGHAVMAVISCAASLWFYPVPYEWTRVAKIFAAALLLFAVGTRISTDRLLLDVFLKSLLVLTFPLVLFLGRFFSEKERRHARRISGMWWIRIRSRWQGAEE